MTDDEELNLILENKINLLDIVKDINLVRANDENVSRSLVYYKDYLCAEYTFNPLQDPCVQLKTVTGHLIPIGLNCYDEIANVAGLYILEELND